MAAADLWAHAPRCPAPRLVAHSHWMGHIPFAFWLVERLKPRLFVELGAYTGVSFCAFCQQIDALGLSCEAYGIDTWAGDEHMGAYAQSVYTDLEKHTARFYAHFACLIRSTFDDALPRFKDGSIDLLHIDGSHSKEAMLHDFEAWLCKISDRGVILMHDICARLPGYGGVEAWSEISARFPSFAFTHGYGLGVVVPGADAPADIMALVKLDQAETRNMCAAFQNQAKIYDQMFALEESRKAQDAQNEQEKTVLAARLEEQRKRGEVLENILTSERLERRDAEHQWELAMHRAAMRESAYQSSLSWKITAPLRKLASLCRR